MTLASQNTHIPTLSLSIYRRKRKHVLPNPACLLYLFFLFLPVTLLKAPDNGGPPSLASMENMARSSVEVDFGALAPAFMPTDCGKKNVLTNW
jgi:hypothetical protein